MGILAKHEIIEYLKKDKLIKNPCRKENGDFEVEPASYDLRVGTIIWKEIDPITKNQQVRTKDYQPGKPLDKQEFVTMQPGQVMIVITLEDVLMPIDLCGTVYSKNRFSRDGILTFTTGHVDPGVKCPIVIRLINLRAIPYNIHCGEPIYTIVFSTLKLAEGQVIEGHPPISRADTLLRTKEIANTIIANAFNDISLTREFIKREECDKLLCQTEQFIKETELGKFFWKMIRKNMIKIIVGIFLTVATMMTIISGLPYLKDLLKRWLQ